jgi:hypothetical protein
MDDTDASHEQLVAEAGRRDLEKASWSSFLISLGIPAALWGLVAFISYSHHQKWDFGFLNIFIALAYPAAGLAAALFTGIFAHRWLGFVTLKTSEQYRRFVHFVGAILLASIVPLLRGDSLSIFSHTIVYLEYHGFFVLKLGAWGAFVGAIAYSGVKASKLNKFPSYPLRWYALLVLGSTIAGSWLVPEGDTSSPFHSYSQGAHYLGPVVVAFIVFHVVTQFVRPDSPSKAETH